GGAGRFRFPAVPDIRPTPDRVRETLFNWLGQDLGGACTLDPFAGSGALSFEALSRGAAPAVAGDRKPAPVSALAARRDGGARRSQARACARARRGGADAGGGARDSLQRRARVPGARSALVRRY